MLHGHRGVSRPPIANNEWQSRGVHGLWLGLTLALAACGRIDFDDLGDAGDLGDAAVLPPARSVLALDRRDPGESLTDFPLLVVLDDTRADRRSFAPGASNLRFFSDTTLLASEIDEAGALGGAPTLVWVRVPVVIGTTTTIEVRYGGVPIAASTESVWSASYAAVWHFGDAGLADSTSGHHDAVPHGSTVGVGEIGHGRSFVSADGDWLTIADAPDLALPQLTGSGWVSWTMQTDTYSAIASRQVGVTPANDLFFGVGNGGGAYSVTNTTSDEIQLFGGVLPSSQWHHVALVADNITTSLFTDGVLVTSMPQPGTVLDSGTPIFLAGDTNDATQLPNRGLLDGALDEIRLENVARDPAWLAADDASMRDELITYGAVTE